MKKILGFIKSLFLHCLSGFPKASRLQIEQRHDICLSCDMYKQNTCLVCGCNINKDQNLMNKLAWADQECPLKKWDKISDKKIYYFWRKTLFNKLYSKDS